jgi:uncharacterized membrane protein
MARTYNLLAAIYADPEHAKEALDLLQKMHRGATINLEDAAMVTREADNKIKVHETSELTVAKGARRGAVIAGVLGVIYPPSLIVSVVAGGTLGAIAGKLRDTGVKNENLKELATKLTPGKAGLIAVTDDESVLSVQQAMKGCEGDLLTELVDEETIKQIFMRAGSGE